MFDLKCCRGENWYSFNVLWSQCPPLPPETIYEKNISVKMKFHCKQKLRKIFQLCTWSYVSKWTQCNKISCIWLNDLQKILWCTLKKYLGIHEIDFFSIGWNRLHQCKKTWLVILIAFEHAFLIDSTIKIGNA